MHFSKRIKALNTSVFSILDEEKQKQIQQGRKIYDFTVGSPNIAPSKEIIDALSLTAQDPKSYMYAMHDTKEFRQTIQKWYHDRYEVDLDPATEILSLQGSQEGLAHIALAICDPGDVVLIPSPSYPVFRNGAIMAQAQIYEMEMKEEYDYLIQFDQIPENIAKRAKMMILSYPNNPTGALASDEFYLEAIAFAKKYDIMIIHDTAYSNLVFDGEDGKSFLYYPGAMDVGVEFNSFSKTYGMAGARIGICVGNKEIVAALHILKSNIDYGMFLPIQRAAIAALTQDQAIVKQTRDAYQKRRDLIVEGCRSVGWNITPCKATMFIWARIPEKYKSSSQFCVELLQKTGILLTDGSAFGKCGEGYVRIALVQDEDVIQEAISLMKESGMFE